MKFGFITCVQIGLSCMEAIYEAGAEIDLAVTLLDDRAVQKSGRIYLDEFCKRKNIRLLKCAHVNDPEVRQAIVDAGVDWLFIVGWSQIAGGPLLNAPKLGVLGMHPTLLPQGRGRAAIPWAILKELGKTGVSLFKMNSGVDSGPIAGQVEIPMHTDTTATELYAAVNSAHIELIKQSVPKIRTGNLALVAQNEAEATEWPGRKPEDGHIDLEGTARDAERLVRAVTRPYPGAFYFEDGRKIIVWSAELSSSPPHGKALKFADSHFLTLKEWEYT